MKEDHQTSQLPKDGLAGLTQNFGKDVTSGFVVFLLALPLSLGIAAASGLATRASTYATYVGSCA